MSGIFGDFGVTIYPSVTAANKALGTFAAADCYGLKRDYSPKRVQIENDLSGSLWANGAEAPILRWRSRGWQFAVCWEGDYSGQGNIAEAKSLMRLLDRYLLPASSGYMVTSLGADNTNTRAAWLDDRAVVETSGLYLQWGVPLASAMRRWQ
jgi:hypothetical protein